MCRRTTGLPLALLAAMPFSGAVGQTLIVTPQELSLASPAGSAIPATSTLSLASTAGATSFTAATRHLNPVDPWLSVSPATGALPVNLTVAADTSKLATGTYLGQVTISAGGVGAVVNVILAVGAPGATGGRLVASPSSITFAGQAGVSELPPQTVFVAAPTGSSAPISFRAIPSSSGWLEVLSPTGITPASVQIRAIAAGLPAGRFSGSVSLAPLDGSTPTVLPVTLLSTGNTNTELSLALSQTALTITHQIGSVNPPSQVVGVTTTLGAREYSASTNASWIRLTSAFNSNPASSLTDFTPGEFNIVTDPAEFVPGTYVGTVEVSSAGLPAVQLPVTLVVTSTAALNAQPSSISLDSQTRIEAMVSITSTGGTTMSINAIATSNGGWLTVTPNSGSTASGSQTLTVRANTTGLAPGVHSGTVAVTAQNGPSLDIPVRITVAPGTATDKLGFVPESIALTALAGSTANPSQVVEISTETGSSHDFTAAALSTGGWLIVEPFTGTAPGRVTVRANVSAAPGLGRHMGSVSITSLVTGQQYSIPVTLEVSEEAIVSNLSSLSFVQAQVGAAVAAQTLEITANAPSTFRIEAPAWLKANTYSGITPATVMVWPDVAMVPAGTNSASIRIIGPKNELTIPVTLVLAELPTLSSTPETVTLTYALGNPVAPSESLQISGGAATTEFAVTVATQSGTKWLSVSPASGRPPTVLRVSVEPSLVVPGRQGATITITPTDGSAQPRVIPVTLTVTSASALVQSILHSATFVPTMVAPGQMITLTGAGLGPAVGVSARPSAAGAYDTRLADTRVLFDGIPAPLLYVSAEQINAITPYAISGRATTKVQVEQGINWSLPIELRVADSLPGIFTTSGSGRGQAAAVNSDNTFNSAANPALRGSAISIYGTGEGQTDPAGQDGRVIVTDLRRPTSSVTARIGGRPAEVLYAGSAPQQVSGMFQVNVRVPEDIPAGASLIEVQVGAAVSQTGVTIAIR